MLDSPVSGGTKGAEEGTLTIMAAGRNDVFHDCLPIFNAFGTKIFKVGDQIGQGQAVKAVNQLLVGVRHGGSHGPGRQKRRGSRAAIGCGKE
ncbi:MAG: NAD(P)-binding domain-containing protein [Negativicutes bacterium]